jgi:hypothetical protein
VRRHVGFVERERQFAIAAFDRSFQILWHIGLAVQIRHVTGIEIAFVGLKVIAFVKNLGHKHMAGRRKKRFVGGKERSFATTHVSKNDPGLFMARIRGVMNFLAKPFFWRFARLF